MNIRTIHNMKDIITVTNILYTCGKDMAQRYDVHHWDNTWIKTYIIVLLCVIKNDVFIVEKDNSTIATYQTKIMDKSYHLEKLAVDPKYHGHGVGSFCLHHIEKVARQNGCIKVELEVYSKSDHAIKFYYAHGYSHIKNSTTRKYDVFCMEKEIVI